MQKIIKLYKFWQSIFFTYINVEFFALYNS